MAAQGTVSSSACRVSSFNPRHGIRDQKWESEAVHCHGRLPLFVATLTGTKISGSSAQGIWRCPRL
jgi:hypothetical protein